MSLRMFIGWWIAAIAAIVAAVVAVSGQPGLTAAQVVDEPAFPQLRERPEDVARISIATADGIFTLARRGDGWVAADHFDYPVDALQVNELIAALSDMRLLEPKTNRPDLFARLEVEDVDGEEAQSRQVGLFDADGAMLADVILGKRITRSHRYGSGGTYVRRGADDRAWLASGSVDVPDAVTDWLVSGVVDIPREEVRRVEGVPAEGDPYVASRADADAEMALDVAVPEGHEADPAAVNRAASVLVNVQLTDVRPAAEMPLPDDRSLVTVSTFDGVEVVAELALIDDEPWARFNARYVPPLAAADEADEEAAPPEQEAPEDTAGAPAAPLDEEEVTPPESEEVTATAETRDVPVSEEEAEAEVAGAASAPADEEAGTPPETEEVTADVETPEDTAAESAAESAADAEAAAEAEAAAAEAAAADAEAAAAAAEAAQARVDAINARVDGWVYRLQDSVAERLNRNLEDLLAGDGTS